MAVTRLRFLRPNGVSNDTVYIDLARELSRHHRKLHRQKMIYTVYGGYLVDNPGTGEGAQGRVDFNVAPNYWLTKAAVNRGFAKWRKSIAKAAENYDGILKQPYSDFKVFLCQDMVSGNTIDSVDAYGDAIVGTTAEWSYSTIISQDPFEDPVTGLQTAADGFECMIVGNQHVSGSAPGDVWQKISLIKSWVDSKAIPDHDQAAPRYTTDQLIDPLENLFDTGDADNDVIESYLEENDYRPYDLQEAYGTLVAGSGSAGQNLQRVATAITVPGSGYVSQIPGFQAINGLIQIQWSSDAYPAEIVLDVESVGVKY